MPRGRFKYVVELALLEAVHPELLFSFLGPFADDLRALGVPIDRTLYSIPWLTQLHGVLNQNDATVPAPLQFALMDIGDVATEAGHDAIVILAIERGVELFPGGKTLARVDLAFHVHITHPDLFRAAHVRLQALRATDFIEFYGKGPVGPLSEGTDPKMAVLRHRLQSSFRARNRTTFCRVMVEERAAELVFILRHGGAPHRVTSIQSREQQEVLTYVPEQIDVVVYDKATSRLSINSSCRADRELYRTTLGFVLAMDEDHFRVWPAFRSDPLCQLGSAALDVRDIAGLERVSLRKLVLSSRDPDLATLELTADGDLAPWLDRDPLHGVLQQRAIGAWTFGVFLPQNMGPFEVHVRPPNQLRFDRRVPLARVRAFMFARGFLRLPPVEASPRP